VECDHTQRDDLVKVTIDLTDDVYEPETLWAESLGEGLYRLCNVPFLAYGYNVDDLVNVTTSDGRLLVTAVARRGGHSTYRVILPDATDDEAFAPLWGPLEKLGYTYERANRRLIGIDVPPGSDVYTVYDVLEKGEQASRWEFEEGHCGHPLCS
jgi:hypothetical protein